MAFKRKFELDGTTVGKKKLHLVTDEEDFSLSLPSSDEFDFADHQFNSPAEDRRHKLKEKKKRFSDPQKAVAKPIEIEEMEINQTCQSEYSIKASKCLKQGDKSIKVNKKIEISMPQHAIESRFEKIRSLYSLSTNDHPKRQIKVNKKLGLQYKYMYRRNSFDNLLYTFPPGVGVAPKDIEDIPEHLLYWPRYNEVLRSRGNDSEEVVIEKIEKKIEFLMDYFKRLEEGKLTKEERRKGKIPPENFHDPYLPTSKHIKILKALDIVVNWPLSELHEACLRDEHSFHHTNDARKSFISKYGINYKLGAMRKDEGETIFKNWIRFQKEYKFYDIRPLIDLKTARFVETKNRLGCLRYNYVSNDTKRKFGLYLLRGVKDRIPCQAINYMRHISVSIINNEWKGFSVPKTLSLKRGLEYLLKKFNGNFLTAELLLGEENIDYYRGLFYESLFIEHIPMRCGPWLPEENRRLEKGILAVTGANSLKDTVNMKIKWIRLLPYVRTRPHQSYTSQYSRLLYTKAAVQKANINFTFEKQLIDNIYESGVESFDEIDWDEISSNIPNQSPKTLKQHFRYLIIKTPSYLRRDFVDTIEFLYTKMDNRYKIRTGLTGRTYTADSTTTEDEEFSCNASMLSDTTFTETDENFDIFNDMFHD